MSNELVHSIEGETAVKIAQSVEEGVRRGFLVSGALLPSVRGLADSCGVSPATVAAAFRMLRDRGVVVTDGRRGTRIRKHQATRPVGPISIPDGVRDLSTGNPDPKLLPNLKPILKRIDVTPHLYGGPPNDARLVALVQQDFQERGIRKGEVIFVNGAMDGMERVMAETLKVGDRVAVEDPSFGNVLDLLSSRGLEIKPVPVDGEGLVPEALARVCRAGISAIVVAPRVQNPTGATMSAGRAAALRRVLRQYPHVLVIEDDHSALSCDVPLQTLHAQRSHWVHICSFSKGIGPDLRLAAMTGDATTIRKVQERMVIGERWVSHLLQRLAAELLSDPQIRRSFQMAAEIYSRRRQALVEALAAQGIQSPSRSGYNVWVPLADEATVVQALLTRGWSVAPGERFRVRSGPAIRVTVAALSEADSRRFADDLRQVIAGQIPAAVVV